MVYLPAIQLSVMILLSPVLFVYTKHTIKIAASGQGVTLSLDHRHDQQGDEGHGEG